MSDFSCFLKANAITVENEKFVASKRFIDPKTKKPVEWEIKPIPTTLDESIRKECSKRVAINSKRGQYTTEIDNDKYLGKLCAACTVYPNLNAVELQNDYDVKDADSLLKAMLTNGEYLEYKNKVLEINGYDISMEQKVDEAKN